MNHPVQVSGFWVFHVKLPGGRRERRVFPLLYPRSPRVRRAVVASGSRCEDRRGVGFRTQGFEVAGKGNPRIGCIDFSSGSGMGEGEVGISFPYHSPPNRGWGGKGRCQTKDLKALIIMGLWCFAGGVDGVFFRGRGIFPVSQHRHLLDGFLVSKASKT